MGKSEKRTFDGVICFGGGDWWYHNHGHYDMQMMREFSRQVPILFVNSVGIRVPKPTEGKMFFRRVLRKLRSLRRGHTSINERFSVLSPFVVPGRLATPWSIPIASRQIGHAARRAGIKRPLVWITCPPGAQFIDALAPVGVVYQRTDRWEAYPDTDVAHILSLQQGLRQRADLTLFCASLLYDEEAHDCRGAAYIDHGVDFDHFAAAGTEGPEEPADLTDIPHPRAGFVGGIDDSTFDPELFVDVAGRLPDVQFVCVGACSLEEGWVDLPNVHLLGQKPYAEVASYMASFDVLLMPWNQSEWIKACNPIKLKEYLAVGRPVVTTPFEELRHYEGLVRVARDAAAFANEIRQGLNEPIAADILRSRVESETWQAKAQLVLDELADRHIYIAEDAASGSA